MRVRAQGLLPGPTAQVPDEQAPPADSIGGGGAPLRVSSLSVTSYFMSWGQPESDMNAGIAGALVNRWSAQQK
jgi:hypothetical protein